MAAKFPETEKFIHKYGKDVETEIKNRLKGHGKYATGKLYKSIKYEVLKEKEDFIVSFIMEDYGVFVDKGVNGTEKSRGSKFKFKNRHKGDGSFLKSLKKWCGTKGIPKNAAYAIRQNIWKYGIAPTNFFTIPTTRRVKQFEKGFEQAMLKDIEEQIRQEFK